MKQLSPPYTVTVQAVMYILKSWRTRMHKHKRFGNKLAHKLGCIDSLAAAENIRLYIGTY
jgi:hypothetical protein